MHRQRAGGSTACLLDSTRTEYVFRQFEAVPLELSLVLGDLIHNLRSALDSLTLAIVQDETGRKLTEGEERACQFPVCTTPSRFQEAVTVGGGQRRFGPRATQAMRSVQPFVFVENLDRRSENDRADSSERRNTVGQWRLRWSSRWDRVGVVVRVVVQQISRSGSSG